MQETHILTAKWGGERKISLALASPSIFSVKKYRYKPVQMLLSKARDQNCILCMHLLLGVCKMQACPNCHDWLCKDEWEKGRVPLHTHSQTQSLSHSHTPTSNHQCAPLNRGTACSCACVCVHACVIHSKWVGDEALGLRMQSSTPI